MPLYQLTLFYPNLKEHSGTVRVFRSEIETISGKNWRVLSAGEQVCAIAFVSDLERKQISTRFPSPAGERFHFLLVEVASIAGGYLSKDVWQWIRSRLPGNE